MILLGNLLDNAIEATEMSESDKIIQVQVIQEEKQLVIAAKNTCTQLVCKANGEFLLLIFLSPYCLFYLFYLKK